MQGKRAAIRRSRIVAGDCGILHGQTHDSRGNARPVLGPIPARRALASVLSRLSSARRLIASRVWDVQTWFLVTLLPCDRNCQRTPSTILWTSRTSHRCRLPRWSLQQPADRFRALKPDENNRMASVTQPVAGRESTVKMRYHRDAHDKSVQKDGPLPLTARSETYAVQYFGTDNFARGAIDLSIPFCSFLF